MNAETVISLIALHKQDHRHNDDHCRRRAETTNQHTFTLIAQDKSAPKVIAQWICENIETAPPEKLVNALFDALIMRNHYFRKAAD